MLIEDEKQTILNAYHRNPEAMERLINALLILQDSVYGEQYTASLLENK